MDKRRNGLLLTGRELGFTAAGALLALTLVGVGVGEYKTALICDLLALVIGAVLWAQGEKHGER